MGASADNASSNATADDVGDAGRISFALFVEDIDGFKFFDLSTHSGSCTKADGFSHRGTSCCVM